MVPCGIYLPLSGLFHLAQCSPGSPMLSQITLISLNKIPPGNEKETLEIKIICQMKKKIVKIIAVNNYGASIVS